jgi:hypothetical protein
MEPDPRLVAALAALLPGAINFHFIPPRLASDPIWRNVAAAILPAFLADLRTHEWLEERLAFRVGRLISSDGISATDYGAVYGVNELAAAILGRQP